MKGFNLPFTDSDRRREKRIEKYVDEAHAIIAENSVIMQTIPDPTDNPLAKDVRTTHAPLEMKGKTILTQLEQARLLAQPQKRIELKEIEKTAGSYPREARVWGIMARASARAERVRYPRLSQQVNVDAVASLPEGSEHNLGPSTPSSNLQSSGPLVQLNLPPHAVHTLPMDLVYAINRYVTPPPSPTCSSSHPRASMSAETLTQSVVVPVTTMSGSDLQSVLTDMATLCIQDTALTETTDTHINISQSESALCPAIAA